MIGIKHEEIPMISAMVAEETLIGLLKYRLVTFLKPGI
jgi:hypothetical protein